MPLVRQAGRSAPEPAGVATHRRRLRLAVLKRYILAIALGNLAWELAQLPLYTIWETAGAMEMMLSALHCTAGDVLIALGALAAGLFLAAGGRWPEDGYRRVAAAGITAGLSYTAASEWLNVYVLKDWAYRDLMPVIPVLEVGWSPILQWMVLPGLSFWWAAHVKGRR